MTSSPSGGYLDMFSFRTGIESGSFSYTRERPFSPAAEEELAHIFRKNTSSVWELVFSLGLSGSSPRKGKRCVVTRCSVVIPPTPPGSRFAVVIFNVYYASWGAVSLRKSCGDSWR